ncbi:MAG TPA: GNAT family N-acetyltransferase [Anaeromyxobacteraceae bacterium]|nr:GNAT family N-acetyltransferase [Anaeromyxobacteraceae bacterium]
MALRLETSRLVLSPVEFADVGALRVLLIHPDVRRWLCDGRVLSEADVRGMVAQSREAFLWRRAGFFAMRTLHDGSLVGLAGLKPAVLGGPELVSALWPSLWRSGLAAEACRVVLHDAFERVGVQRVLAGADAPNFRSLALIHALGFRQIAITPGAFGTIRWFSLERPGATG